MNKVEKNKSSPKSDVRCIYERWNNVLPHRYRHIDIHKYIDILIHTYFDILMLHIKTLPDPGHSRYEPIYI